MKLPICERGVSSTVAIQVAGSGANPTRSLQSIASGITLVKCTIRDVDVFIKAHYLHRRPGVCVLVLRVDLFAYAVGMVVFALPPQAVYKRYGGKTIELARLYLIDEMPRNSETWVISRALKIVKKTFRDVRFVISYADPSVGHTGLIYRASNWTPDGKTDDERKSARCDYVDTRTGKKYSRMGHLPEGAIVARVPRVSKFRFFYKLR